MSKHHLPGHWRRLATSCANTLMTRAPTGTPPPTQLHVTMPVDCVKPLRVGAIEITHAVYRHTAQSASVAKPCTAPTVDLQCKRCKRDYRRLLHTLRIVVAMTNAAKFSQWIPHHGEASREFRDFSFNALRHTDGRQIKGKI